jgi:NAD(P)-dependent dehydrogenase (short-subunit alcohol dehydrogenase family)
MNKIAIVTGSNRGLGLQIVKELLQKNFEVIMTARSEAKGKAAFEELYGNNANLHFHKLDVANEESILAFVQYVDKEFGRADVLINNAGIFVDQQYGGVDIPLDIVRQTLMTNTLGPLKLSQLFIPLMKKNNYGRIVNISSGLGSLHEMGPGYPAYRISKAALNAVTRILASELTGFQILINSMCPGWIKTDMGGSGATRTVQEGAETALWLATLEEGGPTGKFFRDQKELRW